MLINAATIRRNYSYLDSLRERYIWERRELKIANRNLCFGDKQKDKKKPKKKMVRKLIGYEIMAHFICSENAHACRYQRIHIQYRRKNTLIMALNLEMSVSARAHAQLSSLKTSRHPLRYQLEDIIRTSIRIYRNCY